MEGFPCSAGHTACYISPYGDVFPCVQFPLPSGNVRRQKFLDIWRHSPQLKEARSIRARIFRLLHLRPRRNLHTLPRLGLHGGQHARPSTAYCENLSREQASPQPTCWGGAQFLRPADSNPIPR